MRSTELKHSNFKNPALYWNVSSNVSIFHFILEKDARWRLCVVRVRRACLMRWVEASVATPVDFRELSEGILAGASDRCTARSFPLVVKRPLRCEASNYQYSRLRVLHQLNLNQDRSCVAYRWSRHWQLVFIFIFPRLFHRIFCEFFCFLTFFHIHIFRGFFRHHPRVAMFGCWHMSVSCSARDYSVIG